MKQSEIREYADKVKEIIETAARKTLEQNDYFVPKPWGCEIIIDRNDLYVIKRLYIKKGEQLSLQYHENKRETIIHSQGYGRIFKNGKYHALTSEDDVVRVNPYEIHRIEAHPQHDLEVLEVSTPHLDDVVRVQDDYGRD